MPIGSLVNSVTNTARLTAGVYQGPLINPSVQQNIINSVGYNTKTSAVDNTLFVVGTHKMGSKYKVNK